MNVFLGSPRQLIKSTQKQCSMVQRLGACEFSQIYVGDQTHALNLRLIVGRAISADIQMPNETAMSRQHFAFESDDGDVRH